MAVSASVRSPIAITRSSSLLRTAKPSFGSAWIIFPFFPELCRRLIAASPQDWRARLALARHLAARQSHGEALQLLFEAVANNPHALSIHQAIWATLSEMNLPADLVTRYVDLTKDAIFYLDPHVCLKCRYRSTELLWQCPHCYEWNTSVEERIAPARDEEDSETLTS